MGDLAQGVGRAFANVGRVITAPFVEAFNALRRLVKNVLDYIFGAINSAVRAINGVIQRARQALSSLTGVEALGALVLAAPALQVPVLAFKDLRKVAS